MARPFKNRKRRGGDKGTIRQHTGWGKFSGCNLLDEAAYIWSMDSTDIHSNEGWGSSVTLVEGPFTADECRNLVVNHDDKLNRRERREIVRYTAALVFESGDGFIDVEWHTELEKARKRFDDLESNYYGDGDEDEDCDEDEE